MPGDHLAEDGSAAGVGIAAFEERPALGRDWLIDERECEHLLLRHYRNVDSGVAAESAEFFTADAVFTARGSCWRGREEIAAALRARDAQSSRVTVHVLTNFVLSGLDGDAASGSGVLSVYARGSDQRPEAVVPYVAEFVRTTDGWRFQVLESNDAQAI